MLVVLVTSGTGGGGSGSFREGGTIRDFKSEGQRHVEGQVRYRSNPPNSGNHTQVPAENGA